MLTILHAYSDCSTLGVTLARRQPLNCNQVNLNNLGAFTRQVKQWILCCDNACSGHSRHAHKYTRGNICAKVWYCLGFGSGLVKSIYICINCRVIFHCIGYEWNPILVILSLVVRCFLRKNGEWSTRSIVSHLFWILHKENFYLYTIISFSPTPRDVIQG